METNPSTFVLPSGLLDFDPEAVHVCFYFDGDLRDDEVSELHERFSDLITGASAGLGSASLTVGPDGERDDEAVQLRGALEARGLTVERVEVTTDAEMTAQLRFTELLRTVPDLTGLAERAGLSRRALEYKRKGERRVTQWDVWALERAVAVGAGAKMEAA